MNRTSRFIKFKNVGKAFVTVLILLFNNSLRPVLQPRQHPPSLSITADLVNHLWSRRYNPSSTPFPEKTIYNQIFDECHGIHFSILLQCQEKGNKSMKYLRNLMIYFLMTSNKKNSVQKGRSILNSAAACVTGNAELCCAARRAMLCCGLLCSQ